MIDIRTIPTGDGEIEIFQDRDGHWCLAVIEQGDDGFSAIVRLDDFDTIQLLIEQLQALQRLKETK